MPHPSNHSPLALISSTQNRPDPVRTVFPCLIYFKLQARVKSNGKRQKSKDLGGEDSFHLTLIHPETINVMQKLGINHHISFLGTKNPTEMVSAQHPNYEAAPSSDFLHGRWCHH